MLAHNGNIGLPPPPIYKPGLCNIKSNNCISSEASKSLEICLSTRGCLISAHTPAGLSRIDSRQISRDRHARRAGDWKRNESVTRQRQELKGLELDDNRPYAPRCLRSLSSPRPGSSLMFGHDTWGSGTAARMYWKKNKGPSLSLNTWLPNQFWMPFTYRCYLQTAGLLLFPFDTVGKFEETLSVIYIMWRLVLLFVCTLSGVSWNI